MTYYNSAALYGGRNPYGAGFRGGYNVYDEDYTGGWDIGRYYDMVDSNAIKKAGENVIATVGLTPRQKLLIQWWQTPEGGSIPGDVINFAFGIVQLLDSLRARTITANPQDRQLIAGRIKVLRSRLFSDTPGKSDNPNQNRLYKVFTKVQKMIHRKPGINKVKARKWIINPQAAYTRGSWYKALPVPKTLTEAQRANWPATRQKAMDALDAWKRFYDRHRPPSPKRRSRRTYQAWEPAMTTLPAMSALPETLVEAPPPPEEDIAEPESQRQRVA